MVRRPLRAARRALPVVAVLLVALLTVSACIGVETTLDFSADGSGTATVSYRISQFVTKLATAEGEEGGVPLPVSEKDFRAAVADAPGVSLVGNVTVKEDEENISVEARLRYDRVESLAKVRGFGDTPGTLGRDGDRWVYRQVVTAGGREQADAETMQIIEALFAGYKVTFVINAPADIRSASLGEVKGRTVRYSVSVPELLEMTQPTELEVVW
jgi:hypothetical protein